MLRFFLLAITLFISLGTRATGLDTFHIKQYKYKNSIYYENGNTDFDIKIISLNALAKDKADNLYLKPNRSTTQGFGLTYKFVNLNYTYSTIYDFNNFKKGYDLKLNFTVSNRRNIARFFIGNYDGLITKDNTDSIHVAKGVTFFRAGMYYTFIANKRKRFSWSATHYQSERQKKTSSTFLLSVNPLYQQLQSQNLLLTDSAKYQAYFGRQLGLKGISTIKVDVLPGIAVNLALFKGRVYVAPVISLGGGLSFNSYSSKNGLSNQIRMSLVNASELNIGFNGWRLYLNLRGYRISQQTVLLPTQISVADYGGSFTLGWRFGHFEHFIPENIFDIFQKHKKQ